MQCSRCAKSGMVEIRMKIAGEDVMFHSCGRCEAKEWSSIDGPMSLDRVLDLVEGCQALVLASPTNFGSVTAVTKAVL